MLKVDDFAGCQAVDCDPSQIGHAMLLVWTSLGVGNHPGDAYDIGTCFLISPRLLATAHHCITDPVELLAREGVRHIPGEYKLGFRALEPPDWVAVGIREVGALPDVDTAWLYIDELEPRTSALPPMPVLRTYPLDVGERVICAGFTNVVTLLNEVETAERGKPMIGVSAQAVIGQGHVDYADDTDDELLKQLVLVHGVEAPPGMSGGPVYDSFNRCVGLVSRSMAGSSYTRIATWDRILKANRLPEDYLGRVEIFDQEGFEIHINVDNRRNPTFSPSGSA